MAKGDVDVRADEGGGTLKSLPMLRAPEALAGGLSSDHVDFKAERFAIHLQRGWRGYGGESRDKGSGISHQG